MTYPPEPLLVFGPPLRVQFERWEAFPRWERSPRAVSIGARSPLALRRSRSRMKLILLGDPDAVDQCVIELERRGFCDSYAWTPPLIVRENAPPIQPLPGELLRFYQRWYPLTSQQISL